MAGTQPREKESSRVDALEELEESSDQRRKGVTHRAALPYGHRSAGVGVMQGLVPEKESLGTSSKNQARTTNGLRRFY